MLTKEKNAELAKQYGKSAQDSGSPEVQVAIFTERINELTDHLRTHDKDYNTQRALLKLVGKRKKMLSYIQNSDIERYRKILKDLNIRK